MKNHICLVLLVSFSAFGLLFAGLEQQPAGDWTGDWKAVKEAIRARRPKTAIGQLEPILKRALKAEKYAEATRAVAMKIMLESQIEGGKAEERITRLQDEIADLPKPMRPMMEVVLANWYWHYFRQNRWRFIQRTRTDKASGEDILTWDLPRIFAEIDAHFTVALKAEIWLKETPVAEFNDLLVKGTMPDTHRPTLFDFVAYDALRFYSAGEQAGAAAQDAYVLQAGSPALGPPSDFLTWKLESTGQHSPTLKALRLYQELMAFHKDGENDIALAEADLSRLQFAYNKSFGEEKNARYKAALAGFAKHWQDLPIAARALAAHAQVLHTEQLLTDAHAMAQQGWKKFPESVGGRLCYNLLQQIEAKEVSVQIERVWNNPWPQIQVTYRNLTQVHFRVVRYDWESLIKRDNYIPGGIDSRLRKELLGKRPIRQWSHDLPPTKDYLSTSARFEVPDDFEPGFYFLIVSPDHAFGEKDNRVLVQEFWVSPLALVLRSGQSAGKIEGFVLDADTGDPISGAKVRFWRRQRKLRKNQWFEQRIAVRTDKNGLFQIAASNRTTYALLVQHGKFALSTQNHVRLHNSRSPVKPYQRTVFFTDRSLYRPGQTIRFKGICVSVDQEEDKYETVEGKSVTVVFEDANRQQIATLVLRTNAFGSFSGSFTAPRDRLMGRMVLRDARDRKSRTQVSVEEYKRPRFRVELDAPAVAARLGGEVQLPGTATAYTGATIGGAQVSYRVVREVRYPIWWYWRCWWNPPQAQPQEIVHGTTTTESDGTFTVPFTARPDPSVSEKDEPTFRFTIYADVTDTSGETRSDQRGVNIAFTALQASMSTDSWLVADAGVKIRINTQSPDGEPRAAKGTIKVYRLKQPAQVHRAPLAGHVAYRRHGLKNTAKTPEPDLSNPNSWPLGEVAAERGFATDASGSDTETFELPVGPYRAVLKTEDGFGKNVTAILPLQVLDPKADRMTIRVPNVFVAPKWSAEPGATFTALWGTGYEQGRAFVEVVHRDKVLQSYWTRPGVTQTTLEQGVTEAMRGGFVVHVTQVRENRAYFSSRAVSVPWTNKRLEIKWEHFVSKLTPGQKESWTATITGPDLDAAVAEMVATLYDASLDAYLPHHWPRLDLLRRNYSVLNQQFQNTTLSLRDLHGSFDLDQKSASITFRSLPWEIVTPAMFGMVMLRGGMGGFGGGMGGFGGGGGLAPMSAAVDAAPVDGFNFAEGKEVAKSYFGAMQSGTRLATTGNGDAIDAADGGSVGGPTLVDLSNVAARKNLNETAFFFPHLVTGKDGQVTMTFTMPEALTEWKLLGFAHDTQLRSGSMTDTAVTSKDLMIQPLAPRFLREGDVVEFTVKVINQSPTRQTGTVRLSLSDARTLKAVDQELGNTKTDRAFDIPSKQSESFSWRLKVPDSMGFLTYKAVGSTGRLADGEEGYLPVLSRRILVTESLPLPIRGAGTKKFEFTKLLESAGSDSLQSQSLTVQMVSNPAWYAVMALPYLMEYPHECSEQTFNRLYANALARHIANADPKIRRIFDQWKNTPALDSPMEKNQELKAVMLEETPWVRQAKKESQARRDVGILFDANRLQDETARALRKLSELQEADGSWPWFPGGRPNDYITLYITTGFGRLRHLGTDINVAPAIKSLTRLDTWIDEKYRNVLKHGKKEDNHLTSIISLYLYGRSFFLDDLPVAANHKEAVEYYLAQARTYWMKLSNRQSEAHVAIALKRFGHKKTPQDIMISLKERSVSNEEMGMFWRDTELSWWWYRAPIETQAMMIEAFDEVMNDAKSVEDCRVWLLKQKQTQDWKTTKATADAVYGLLLRGSDSLASDALVKVSLGGLEIKPKQVEAGTGFYEERLVRSEIKPEMGHVTVTKTNPGVAWGSVHWQYLEDIAKIAPYEGTPLKLKKELFIKKNTKKGPVLIAVNGSVSVGDELVVRLELRVDRDMEYVHLKDQRGSGLEPVNVLSRYRYQDGLAYYETTRDTASHFFIAYLPKGTYIFEYSTRVVHRGQYQSGMAQIQCMYAPEFNSHSQSLPIKVE